MSAVFHHMWSMINKHRGNCLHVLFFSKVEACHPVHSVTRHIFMWFSARVFKFFMFFILTFNFCLCEVVFSTWIMDEMGHLIYIFETEFLVLNTSLLSVHPIHLGPQDNRSISPYWLSHISLQIGLGNLVFDQYSTLLPMRLSILLTCLQDILVN